MKKHRKASSKDISGAAIPSSAGRSRSAIHAAMAVSAAVTEVGTAHAQSSVTLYGFLDEGINYTSNV